MQVPVPAGGLHIFFRGYEQLPRQILNLKKDKKKNRLSDKRFFRTESKETVLQKKHYTHSVMEATQAQSTMSSAEQPRETSLKGLRSPCTSGPMAVAPARRSVAL